MDEPQPSIPDSTMRTRSRKPRAGKPEGQYHHGDLYRSLVDWGTHLLNTEGAEAMTLRSAARLAGVSPAAPSHHFKDKNGLLAAIAAQGFRDLGTECAKASAQIADPRDRLNALTRAYIEFSVRYPARFSLMFGGRIVNRHEYPELLAASTSAYHGLIDAIAPLLGQDAAKAMTLDDFTFCVWAYQHGLAGLAGHRPRAASAALGQQIDEMSALFTRFVLAAARGLEAERTSKNEPPAT